MKRIKHELLWVGAIYFLILLGIALWVRDIPNQPDVLNTTIQDIINTSTMGDPASFATAAIDIEKNGWIRSENDWIFNLWPPGFILLEALIIKMFGLGTPVILVLQTLVAVLFSVVLTLLYNLLKAQVKRELMFFFPLLIIIFPVTRVFLFQPLGVTLGEGFSVGFFLLAILFAFRSVKNISLADAVYAGFCIALSAYFRSQFELILFALTGWGVLLAIVIWLTRSRRFIDPICAKTTLKTIAVILVVAHVATMPWRAYHWIYQGSPFWVKTAEAVTFRNAVMSTAHLESMGGGFVATGGGNLVCRIDASTCGDAVNAKNLFFKTFLENPVEWYSFKLDIIGSYWFSSVHNWVGISVKSTPLDIATNTLLLIALGVTILLLFTQRVRRNDMWFLLVWFNVSLFSAYILIFTVAHFEVRYFYFPKISIMVMSLMVACLYCSPTKMLTRIPEP